MESIESTSEYLQILSERLQRLSADSKYAHRASGLRGNIIKVLFHTVNQREDILRLKQLIDCALEILSAAAKEIPEPMSLLSPPRPEEE